MNQLTWIVAASLSAGILSGCKTRSESYGRTSASEAAMGRQLIESYAPALLVAQGAKGPSPVCAAIPIQAGTQADQWLVTSRFCIEKHDKSFMDGNAKTGRIQPSLKVSYLISDERASELKLNSTALEPVEIEEYFFLPDNDRGLTDDEAKKEEEDVQMDDDSPVAVQEPVTPAPVAANRCASALTVLRVKDLPARGAGFKPNFMPIADMDEQNMEPLRQEPEFSVIDIESGSKESDVVDYLPMIWKGPAAVTEQGGLRFGLTPFEIIHVPASNEVFAVRPVGEAPKLMGFEIGLPLIGGFRREEDPEFNYREPKIHGIYLGQSKWKEPNLTGNHPTFLNLAMCTSQIRQLIVGKSAYDRPSSEE